MTDENYNSTERGVREAWDFWLSQHDVSVPETIHSAIKDVMGDWLRRNADDLFTKAIAKVARPNMPDAETIDAIATLAAVRELAENWDEEEDGPDAADFLVRLRPLLGLPNPD